MKLTELNEALGEEIIRVRNTEALSKDDLHRVDSIAKLSKQVNIPLQTLLSVKSQTSSYFGHTILPLNPEGV